MTRVLLLLSLLLALTSCGADGATPLFGDSPADGLDLRSELERVEVELTEPDGEAGAAIEDPVVVVDLFEAAGVETDFLPELPDSIQGSVEREFERPWNDGRWTRFRITLLPLGDEELVVPGFEVRSDDLVATTEDVTIAGSSIVAVGAELDSVGDVLREPTPWWPFAVGVPVLLALLWLARLWWHRRAARDPEHARETAIPPHVAALRALARLRNASRVTPAEIEAFYVEVSQVLRIYLEGRFGLRAPERTTEEFLPEVERSGLLGAEQQGHLRQFLDQCDLVKFAGARPTDDAAHSAVFDFAENFVDATRPERSEQEGAA